MLKSLGNNFFKGLLIVGPLAITAYVIYAVVIGIDSFLNIPIPGLGLLITVGGITFIGIIASNVVGRRVLRLTEGALNKLPLVRFLYSSIKDLVNAFVGERRGFDRPVLVQITSEPEIFVMGFLTSEKNLADDLPDHVTVYLPQSYNIAGNLLMVPRARVRPLPIDSSQLMAFIVSGGVSKGSIRSHAHPSRPAST